MGLQRKLSKKSESEEVLEYDVLEEDSDQIEEQEEPEV